MDDGLSWFKGETYCLIHRKYNDGCVMFISPTEPPELRAIGATDLLPEEFGADILWDSPLGRVGIQRKVFPGDFLSSVHDDRLYEGLKKMKQLDIAILLLEGKQLFTTEGQLIRDRNGKRSAWSRDQHRNYLTSVQLRGIQYAHTDSLSDTIGYVNNLRMWTYKGDHRSLDIRSAARGDAWGTITNVDYQRHLLQGLPGVGPKQADAIIQTLGFIFGLTVGEDELMTVPGIGKGRARKIAKVFENGHQPEHTDGLPMPVVPGDSEVVGEGRDVVPDPSLPGLEENMPG